MATVLVRRARVGLALFLAAGLLAAAGCGGNEFKRVPVSGTATLDGKPFTGGVIHFYPDPAKGNTTRCDCLGPVRDGKFTLVTTAVRDTDSGSGAPVGWYKVYLDTTTSGEDLKIHPKYTASEKTDISVEVVESPGPQQYVIKFTSK